MIFVVDFDGTIAPEDTVDALLGQLADPSWKEIEEQWISGRLNSRECMEAQLALVSAERVTLEAFFRSVVIDPSFGSFVRYAQSFADVAVVSDGLDYPIRVALQRHRVPPMPVFANRMEFREHGLGITFPHADADCGPRSGVCKCSVARSLNAGRSVPVILIGDGRSDLCLAKVADHVFAKGSLLQYCRSEGITHTPFDSFENVLTVIRTWDTVQLNRHREVRHAR
jgi:2-hydroxy-3-keto-5-methylthiopentenyl-1-phosphate phosphatase